MRRTTPSGRGIGVHMAGILILALRSYHSAAAGPPTVNEDLPCTLDFFGIKSMDLGEGHEEHGVAPAVLPLREPAPAPVRVLEPASATE